MAITLTTVAEGELIGGGVWLFAVPDGDPGATTLPVMLSTESTSTRTLQMGRVDPLDAATYSAVAWCTITLGLWPVQDHWHVLVRGEHWLSYSSLDTYLQLFKLAPTAVVAGVVPSEVSVVTPSGLGGMVEGYITNDHFIVPMRSGVAVGVWDMPNQLIKLVMLDSTFTFRATADVGGAAADGGSGVNIANGSSAVHAEWPPAYRILASTDLAPTRSGEIVYLVTDRRWSDAGRTFITIAEPGYNLQMATVIVLPDQWSVITFKRIDTSNIYDGGDIVRNTYDDTGVAISSEVLFDSVASGLYANRPHTQAYTNGGVHYIITTWDQTDPSTGTVTAHMRADEIG